MVRLDSLVVDPNKTALIVVDVQNDFCASQPGCNYFDRQVRQNRDDLTIIQDTIENYLIPFINRARKAGLWIVYTRATYEYGQHSDMPNLCIEGTKGWEFYKLSPDLENDREAVIRKTMHNAFENNELKHFLDEKHINFLLIAGVTTDQCVSPTTYGALNSGYKPIVLEDCVSTAGYKRETVHKQKLKEFASHEVIGLVNSNGVSFEIKITTFKY